jgi:hypothetical protein
VLARAEIGEQDRAVVRDGGDPEALACELRLRLFQLELGFAVGSPVGGADEHQKETFGPAEGLERLQFPELVDNFEGGNPGAHCRTRFHVFINVEDVVQPRRLRP